MPTGDSGRSDTNGNREALIALLNANRTRRSNADVERNAAQGELRELIVRGYQARVDVATMARTAEISRDTAHRIIKDAGVMPWAEKREWVGQVLNFIPRGGIEQNMFRSLVNMTLLRALGSRSDDGPHSLTEALNEAEASIRNSGFPNFEATYTDRVALIALGWPT